MWRNHAPPLQHYKKRGAIASFIIIPIFGALMPAAAPLFIAATIRTGIGIVVPAQMFFGPAAFVTYHILAWRTPERSMAEWYNIQAAMGRQPARVVRRVRPAVSQGVGSR